MPVDLHAFYALATLIVLRMTTIVLTELQEGWKHYLDHFHRTKP